MSSLIQSPFEIFLDQRGEPLQNGQIFIGTVNQNPETNPITVYWDAGLTIPAVQPIRTNGGYPWRSGTAARVFVTDDYSITVKDKNGVLVFSDFTGSPFSASSLLTKLKSVDGSGSGLIAEGLQSIQITDLNFDPSLLGLAVREIRTYTTSSGPANPPAGSSTTYWTLILSFPATGEFRLVAIPNGATQNIYTRTWIAGWSAWQTGGGASISLTSGSPYSLVAGTTPELLINATTNPYVVNLPAATGSGYRIRIVNTSNVITGIVKIAPATGERIQPLVGDVAAYIQNIDQSGTGFLRGSLELVDVFSGRWAVVGGQFMPEPGSVDAAGTQYFLGKLRHLPLGNTSSRSIITGSAPGIGTFSASIQATGVVGVPNGAKAVRVKVIYSIFATGAGDISHAVLFSDNNSSVPTANTAHPSLRIGSIAVAINNTFSTICEVDIPLDSTGKFYTYTLSSTNVGSTSLSINAVGYYMGD